MERKEQETKELNGEEMEQASGGTFDRDQYKQSQYEAAGMTYVYHTIAPNEFWWNGTNIGHACANLVVEYFQDHGRQPASLDEARSYARQKRESEHHGCDLIHGPGAGF